MTKSTKSEPIVITERDREVAAATLDTAGALAICLKCGWYETYNHASRCDERAGRAASSLIAALPSVRSGKLGYGDGAVVFDLAEDFTVTFRVTSDGFRFDDVHCLYNLDQQAADELVRRLNGWVPFFGKGKGNPRTLSPAARVEKVIADALGKRANDLPPDRWDAMIEAVMLAAKG